MCCYAVVLPVPVLVLSLFAGWFAQITLVVQNMGTYGLYMIVACVPPVAAGQLLLVAEPFYRRQRIIV